MKWITRSLRTRIFLSMIFLVLGASVLIAGVTVYQYKKEAEAYQRDKLKQKEASIRASINYEIQTTTYPVVPENMELIFRKKIYELRNIHNTEINIYNLSGQLVKSSKPTFFKDSSSTRIPKEILNNIRNSPSKRFVNFYTEDGEKLQSSFTYITDKYFKPLGILNLPHIKDDGFIEMQLKDFLRLLAQVYLVLIIAAILLSYFLSKYITSSLKTVSEKIHATRLDKENTKISVNKASDEVKLLITAYNSMIDELEESAIKLAKSEREQAWREMAKQVAHEIKNPLTPMRLTVQSFERNFNPQDPNIKQKLKEYSQTLIQQIDTMSSIASAFSNFAKMPAQQSEQLNVPEIVGLALDIFKEHNIEFSTEQGEIKAIFDRSQLIRVVTNLVKNALQASEGNSSEPVKVAVYTKNQNVLIEVSDKGSGIPEEYKNCIFEPKFTTKTSGMGLGLGIIKNIVEAYKGSITFTTEINKGTTFYVKFPKL
ncbi:PAS domain-containing sensor histidine kinase [Mesonia sp. HuA40]|uniref:sensor histidine kinase n=1 Tax=Mesonia sp. HuA40 TaxID=2602761 RepID=UPI0011CADDB5|nr:ATP-binding protein [Mesonia sp. HuA40]TXK72704.1 GHKL domain-containing protein [Mesonia sp. HuA40]